MEKIFIITASHPKIKMDFNDMIMTEECKDKFVKDFIEQMSGKHHVTNNIDIETGEGSVDIGQISVNFSLYENPKPIESFDIEEIDFSDEGYEGTWLNIEGDITLKTLKI